MDVDTLELTTEQHSTAHTHTTAAKYILSMVEYTIDQR